MLVVHHRGGTGHVGLEARRGRTGLDDVADRLHRFVRQALALVAGQVELDVGGFVVGTLRAGGRQWIAPEVLDVLDVPAVGAKFGDQVGVVVVCLIAQRGVGLEQDHR